MEVSVVSNISNESKNSYYDCNREPLQLSSLSKLPLKSIKAKGWLNNQLELMVKGMVGNLTEISDFLSPENGWLGGDDPGWEEQPYWLRGFHDLAVLTENKELLKIAEDWIESVLESQDEDGYFGPKSLKKIKGNNGQEIIDIWPHMVMLDVLRSYYENTGDERVSKLMDKFFQFCRDLPEERFIPKLKGENDWRNFPEEYGTWHPRVQAKRAGDMIPHIYWLYNKTGEEWLLDLSTRFFQHIMPPINEWLDPHVVHFTQRFRYPGNYYLQSGKKWHLNASEYWYNQHLSTWGQQPRGIFGADEQVRTNHTDPRQGFETCAMVEFAKSFYILGRITGESKYADWCEDIMLNHFPASQTPELKGLHYLTASNQPQLDATREHEYGNKGIQISYSPHIYRCCQHNVAMGWPWYVKNLWQATSDDGLVFWLYASSNVSAKVGKRDRKISIEAETDYPFSGVVLLTIKGDNSIKFPLYLRIPRWCERFNVEINDKQIDITDEPGFFVKINRKWNPVDRIKISMKMNLSLTEWPRNGSVTVDRGPLSYSVKIEEEWKKYGGTEKWPEWEVFPSSPWNYGLLVNRKDPKKSFEIDIIQGELPFQPWGVENAPIEIKAAAKRIPGWGLENETVQELRTSPIKSNQPEEEITLIPLGCARLRMSCLPTIGTEPEAREWD